MLRHRTEQSPAASSERADRKMAAGEQSGKAVARLSRAKLGPTFGRGLMSVVRSAVRHGCGKDSACRARESDSSAVTGGGTAPSQHLLASRLCAGVHAAAVDSKRRRQLTQRVRWAPEPGKPQTGSRSRSPYRDACAMAARTVACISNCQAHGLLDIAVSGIAAHIAAEITARSVSAIHRSNRGRWR
jgi:hypothetical protein